MKAYELYRKAAVTNGDPTAYLRIAHFYRDGLGIEKNHDKYIRCLTFSAERGNKEAISELAIIQKTSEVDDVKPNMKKNQQ